MGQEAEAIRLFAHRLSGGVVMTPPEITEFGQLLGPQRLIPRGQGIVAQGEVADLVWLLAGGWCLRQKVLPDGRRQILAIMLPGELTEKPPVMAFGAPHGVVAATDSVAHPIRRTEFDNFLDRHPHILRGLLYEEISRHAITAEWVLLLGQRQAPERLAYLLFETYARLRALGAVAGNSFDMPVTQQEVADILGMTAVHLSRTLQKLRADNLVIWTGGVVTLPDPNAVARLAQFDPAYRRVGEDFAARSVPSPFPPDNSSSA